MNDELIKTLNEKLDTAIGRGKQLLADENLQVKAEEIKNKAESTIRMHPIKSVLIGLSIGFLVGKILSSED
tara:strand:- start:15819 stop:16031 length:213 start_codon:yes stop_codon:yes gene_type:complete